MDTRAKSLMMNPSEIKESIVSAGFEPCFIYFEADDETIFRRYNETRRKHPMGGNETLDKLVRAERKLMLPYRKIADQEFDTSHINVHELRDRLMQVFASADSERNMQITVQSFGFSYGTPKDANIMFDVRFLPNPHFVKDLRSRTGLDESVRAYVLGNPETIRFMSHVDSMCEYLLPRYVEEGKVFLNIAVGCTGGRHRSVAIAEALSKRLREHGHVVHTRHMDIQREVDRYRNRPADSSDQSSD
jgi:UPF0042 nucleotide-binding protein